MEIKPGKFSAGVIFFSRLNASMPQKKGFLFQFAAAHVRRLPGNTASKIDKGGIPYEQRYEFPSGRSRRSDGRRYRRISVFRQKTPHGKETQTQRRKSDESYGRSSRQRVLHDEIVPKTRCAESGGFIFCSRMHIFLVSMMSALIAIF